MTLDAILVENYLLLEVLRSFALRFLGNAASTMKDWVEGAFVREDLGQFFTFSFLPILELIVIFFG